MIRVRRAADRGRADHGWLLAQHTFSFAGYRDPAHDRFRALRVLNEDRIAPGRGFGTHPHRDMEIVTLVLEGALEHKDSMGNGEVLRPGEFQRMTAGSGITHSEFNPSPTEPTHLYQIWLEPSRRGLTPSYEQRRFDDIDGRLRLVAAPDAADGALTIHTDARVYLARLQPGERVQHPLAAGRHAWLQVLRGEVTLADEALAASDGAAVSDEAELAIEARQPAELLLFDLA